MKRRGEEEGEERGRERERGAYPFVFNVPEAPTLTVAP